MYDTLRASVGVSHTRVEAIASCVEMGTLRRSGWLGHSQGLRSATSSSMSPTTGSTSPWLPATAMRYDQCRSFQLSAHISPQCVRGAPLLQPVGAEHWILITHIRYFCGGDFCGGASYVGKAYKLPGDNQSATHRLSSISLCSVLGKRVWDSHFASFPRSL